MKIGSHVALKAPDMFYGSVKEALEYNASAFMIYTGAPQNTKRKEISELKIKETHDLLKGTNISLDSIVVHAPYIINLANTIKPETFEIAVEFLAKEIKRTEAMGIKYIVLHPGSHVGAGSEEGLKQVVKGLDMVLSNNDDVIVCLETMSGKGNEVGITFEEIKYIIDNTKLSHKLGVCLDTCHVHDAGYDLNDVDNVLKEFDQIIGLDKLHVLHINDSKNEKGASKDRHENIGYGHIGFDNISNFVHNPLLKDKIFILETPYIDKEYPPYKEEIEMIKSKVFSDWIE
ncbi:MAG: deoxyribonuclease IV [Mycoplasmatales bacterium]